MRTGKRPLTWAIIPTLVGGLLLAVTTGAAGAGAATPTRDGFDVVDQTVVPHTATVTIALVAPPGTTPNFTPADARQSAEAAAEFLADETDGALTVDIAAVSDWMYPDIDAPCSWESVWQDYAAERLGWSRAPGAHLTVMVPYGDPCPGWANGEQNGSVADGGRTFQPGADASTLAHEWGHNFSQAHAFSTACASSWDFREVDGATPADCQRSEYGNRLDNMGGSWTLTPFSSPSLQRIGMLPQVLEPPCDTTATTVVNSVAAGAAGRDPVTWESSAEPDVRYWIDYRDQAQSAKYDALHHSVWAFTPSWSGLQILRTDPSVRFGATVLRRPGDDTDGAQLVRAGEVVTLTDGTRVSWEPVAGGTATAAVTVHRTCEGDAGPTPEPTAEPTATAAPEPSSSPQPTPENTPTAQPEPTTSAGVTPTAGSGTDPVLPSTPGAAASLVSVGTVRAGDTVRVQAIGLRDGEQLAAELHSRPVRITGIPAADSTGRVGFDVRVPATTPAGAHTIIVFRADGTELARLPLTVTRTPALAQTGSNVPAGAAAAGGAFVLLGAVGVMVRRARRARM